MISIELDENIRTTIETKHWSWFEAKFLDRLKELAETYSDSEGRSLFEYLLDAQNRNNRVRKIVLGSTEDLKVIVSELIEKFPAFFKKEYYKEKIDRLTQVKRNLPHLREVNRSNCSDTFDSIELIINEHDWLLSFFQPYQTISTVQKCKQVIRKIKNKISITIKHLDQLQNDLNKRKKELFNDISLVFDYKNFTSDYKGWGAYKLAEYIDVKVCPYCNRSYIHMLNNNDGRTRPEFDHYYPKSYYPFLAVSLFNLIPSCSICNSSLKGNIDFFEQEHIYPYKEDYINEAIFQTNIIPGEDGTYPIQLLYGIGNESDFNLNIVIGEKSPLKNKIQNNINTFKIEELYQFHKDYVLEIIKKTVFYNSSRLLELTESEPYNKLFKSKEEIVRTIIGNYVEESKLGKRVLAKLTKDIWEEFKLNEVWNMFP